MLLGPDQVVEKDVVKGRDLVPEDLDLGLVLGERGRVPGLHPEGSLIGVPDQRVALGGKRNKYILEFISYLNDTRLFTNYFPAIF
jgi:hypothetical protein